MSKAGQNETKSSTPTSINMDKIKRAPKKEEAKPKGSGVMESFRTIGENSRSEMGLYDFSFNQNEDSYDGFYYGRPSGFYLATKHTFFWPSIYLWGEEIEVERNELSYPQRIKVFNYNYSHLSNKVQGASRRYNCIEFRDLDKRSNSDNLEELRSAKSDLEAMKNYNRFLLIKELWDCNQRARLNGIVCGFTIAAVINGTILYGRKPGLKGLVFLACWQSQYLLAGSGFTRRAIDPLYNFFWADSERMRRQDSIFGKDAGDTFGKYQPVNQGYTDFEVRMSQLSDEKRSSRRAIEDKVDPHSEY